MLDAIKTGGRDGLSVRTVGRAVPAFGAAHRVDRDAAFTGFILPLLGIIFLPFATLIYVLLYTPGRGLSGWDWFWVVLAGLLDIGHWGASATQRNQIPGRRASQA